ncbi:hypothetical protein P9G40_07725 [Bacillus velezensis]|uniref:P-loop ATPase, Sll1717 family n=1 Tax=Bacillus TaxID=1386 RepID=UPI000710B348|nr:MULTISPECIES: hypothetical protein [Bacillus]HDR6218951.1 hypothetical protein [Bacillus cereus]ASZ05989.1 hypothetical protein CJP14_20055 [Bacillus velezensis]MCC5595005.1 hypothetical protein [Bacillus velezensis]MDV2628442.1 hypothetical protein [Bacillus velezensis]MDV5128304.1 hypothetical protein [Bacillus velezensis]
MERKIDLLMNSRFGERVAEEDENLASYFVETAVWNQLLMGEIDVVRGVKGSGKSALYMQLLKKEGSFAAKNTLLIPAENLEGTPVFKSVLGDADLTETSFQYLWSIYIITLIGDKIKDFRNRSEEVKDFIRRLELEGLLEGKGIRRLLTNVRDYVFEFFRNVKEVEGVVTVEPTTNIPILKGKISLNEPSKEHRELGAISIFELLEMANEALKSVDLSVWITFDRLDVAFPGKPEFETLALRTLFQVYNNIKLHKHIKLKIFIREDIWKRITKTGFREASHITKQVTIDWSEQDFLHLLVSRILENDILCKFFNVEKDDVLKDSDKQKKIFYSIFPKKVEVGKNPETFKWMIGRVKDGLKITAPRELIHLMNEARAKQIKLLETGTPENSYSEIIGRSALKDALKVVSKIRLEQTIYAEYAHLKKYIEKLEDQKTEHDVGTLSKIFLINKEDTINIANELVSIGFFEEKKGSHKPYWTPFLYRAGLNMVQGKED